MAYKEIKGQMYQVTLYGCSNKHFIECDDITDLFEYCAREIIKGAIFMSAKEINKDGSTPKVKVQTDKRFKEIYKRLLKEKEQ